MQKVHMESKKKEILFAVCTQTRNFGQVPGFDFCVGYKIGPKLKIISLLIF
jgi:hypothetical protein